MYVATGRTSPTRFAVVSVLMLGVLLGSLGVAWVLVRRHPSTRGTGIVAQLRKDGLAAHWDGTSDQWLLIRGPHDLVTGWRASFTRAEKDGRFRGLRVHVFPPDRRRSGFDWEFWKLNDSATQGEFVAGQLGADRSHWYLSRDTWIKLNEGYLEVEQRPPGHTINSESPMPDNYIPRGIRSLVCLLVARGKTRAQFKFIENSKLPHELLQRYSTSPRFIEARIRHVSRVEPEVPGAAAAVAVTYTDGAELLDEFTHVFDKTGKTLAILRKRGPNETAATWDQVKKRFPAAAEQLRSLSDSKMLDFPLPTKVTGPAPKKAAPGTKTPKGRRPGTLVQTGLPAHDLARAALNLPARERASPSSPPDR